MSKNNHGVRYLEMGSCYNGYRSFGEYNDWISCAWEPDDCDLTIPGNSFVGTDQDEDFIKQCNPNDQRIGRCALEDTCALRASDCGMGSSSVGTNFIADDPTCTIQRDRAKEWDVDNPKFTQFGSCLDRVSGDYFCVYNPTDCDESGNEVYVNPADTLALKVICDCSQVHVAACVTDSKRAFCAINADGCRPFWPYYSPHTQRLHRDPTYSGSFFPAPGLDCRLCRKKNTVSPTPAPTTFFKPSENPTSSSIALPTTQSPTQSSNVSMLKTSNESSKVNVGAIVGGTVGGVVFIGILFFIYIKMFRDMKQKQTRKNRVRPPIEIFTNNQ